MPKKYSKKQRVYKMKGCSKKTMKKKYLGGNVASGNINLAYPSNNVPTAPNPFLSYTGKGGSSELTPSLEIPVNTNAADKTIPNTGPSSIGYNFINNQGAQRGGNCGCSMPLMSGGCGPLCAVGFMVGGKKHRLGCKCSNCKSIRGRGRGRTGGWPGVDSIPDDRNYLANNYNTDDQKGGNNGIPYPDGLVGSSWKTSVGGWPGVDSIPGDRNYLANNNYNTDVQRAIIPTGANPPFSIGGRKRKTRRQRGGALSNFIAQDLINLGRQVQFGVGSAYNAVAGYAAPVNPMPWKDQLVSTPNFSTLRR
jgi:hypothetical protein